MKEIAGVLGPEQVFFISQDDKSRVPIGLTAANKQAPLLMDVEYKLTLPDHGWVWHHSINPSLQCGIVMEENGFDSKLAVTNSDPTFVAIRSGKHSSSMALSHNHANDVETLLSLPEFDEYCGVVQIVQ